MKGLDCIYGLLSYVVSALVLMHFEIALKSLNELMLLDRNNLSVHVFERSID